MRLALLGLIPPISASRIRFLIEIEQRDLLRSNLFPSKPSVQMENPAYDE